jgi:WD40 repeat protein
LYFYYYAYLGGYDKKINVWTFANGSSYEASRRGGGNSLKSSIEKSFGGVGVVPQIPAYSLIGHEAPVVALAHSGSQILSGARDGGCYFWNIATGSLLRRYRGHKGLSDVNIAFYVYIYVV